ncbi:MAG: hypothetical protein ACO3VF_00190 [Tamlana sp.]
MKYFKILILCLISSLTYAQYDVTTVGNSETLNNCGLWVISKGTTENIGGRFICWTIGLQKAI